MVTRGIWSLAGVAATAALLGGCVAATPLSVAPGQGKSYTDLQRDDAACRATPAAAGQPTASTAAAPAGNYYQCMATKGELVVANQTVAYPGYVGYPYAYAAPFYGYPYYGYPYPATYLGLGFGFGYGGGFYHGGYFHEGYRGGYFHGGYRGGEFHGGGFHR